MSLGSDIFTKLSANAGVAALVVDRIYPSTAPENAALPHITWQQVGADPLTTLSEPTGTQFNLVQFSLFTADHDALEALIAAVKAALDNEDVGTSGNATFQDEGALTGDSELCAHRLDFLI